VPQAAAQVVRELPDAEAHTFVHALTGVSLGSERRHTLTHQAAQELTGWDVAPSREPSEERLAAVAAGPWHRPVVGLGLEGALVPTRPESARGQRPGQRQQRAKRPRGQGAGRDATGVRFSLIDEGRIVPRLRWPQGHDEAERGEALQQGKAAGVLPADPGRLGVVCDGASWLWQQVHALFPEARQGLDSDHCKEDLQKVAKAQEGTSQQALAWVDATLTRLYGGKVAWVLGGVQRMQAHAEEAAKAMAHGGDYLHNHRDRTHDRQLRRGG
jgi:hypothetical protein